MVMLNNIDDYRKDSASIRNIFAPIKGNYNYYQFLSTFKGLAMIFPEDDPRDSIKVFHDILIIKTNEHDKIVDSYHYTTEWAEQPSEYDLFRGSIRNIPLTDGMDINTLKFVRTEYFDSTDKYLVQKGVIKIK